MSRLATEQPDSDNPLAAQMVLAGEGGIESDANAYWVERAATLDGLFPTVQATGMAGIYGIANASGLARVWSAAVALTKGMRLIGDAVATDLSRPRSVGRPHFGGEPPYQHWGSGVMVPSPWEPYLTPRSAMNRTAIITRVARRRRIGAGLARDTWTFSAIDRLTRHAG